MGCSVSAVENSIFPKGKKINQNSYKNGDLKMRRITIEEANQKFDPRLPLTVRQKFNIVKSWKGIAREIEATGVNMFLRLFETNEEVRSMFTNIVYQDGTYDIAKLRESKELDGHVKMVMYTLDEAISSLEDVDVVVNTLHMVGRSHRQLQHAGFNPAVFWKIEEPFLCAVKETLGDRFSANMEHIYRKTIKFILESLMEGYAVDTDK